MGMFGFIFYIALLLFLFCRLSFAAHSINPNQSINDGATLVSKEGIFELGFFSRGNSTNRYLGIWYRKVRVQKVVWVANGCNPINDISGLLTINSTGNLVLMNKNTSTVVWLTSLSTVQPQKPILQLLDSGNLVLRDENDGNSQSYLWQSFDYPCDTLLPGMKLGWDLKKGLNRRLSAWKNWDDPCPANFTYGVELDAQRYTYPEIVIKKDGARFYRSGPWNGLRFSGAPELMHNPIFDFDFVYNDDEVYYIVMFAHKSVITISVVNATTSLRYRLTWVESEETWKTYSFAPRDNCDIYNTCGANGMCVASGSPICHCLDQGFKPKSQEKWNLLDWSEGCERIEPLSCLGKDEDDFVKISGLKLPDATRSWVNKSTNLKECRAKCLSDRSCMAYTNSNISGKGSGCVIWFGNLYDIRQLTTGGQDLFVRMSHLKSGRADKVRKLIAILVAVVGGVCVMLLLGCFISRRRPFKDHEQEINERIETVSRNAVEEEDEFEDEELDLPLFSMSIMISATQNFSENNILGKGGFGPVYKGKLEDRQDIAVKRLSLRSEQGVKEFKTEVKLISKLQHRNLVSLIGCCIERKEKMLVYEYLPNGSLDYFIFDLEQQKLLEWRKRFQIICGISRGLLYLHQDSRLRIIHRDLKASNILLDNNMNPRISDFGLARILGVDQIEEQTYKVIGTYGYIAPEYALGGLFSIKSDVFSFGILVLEILSGKKSSNFHLENNGVTLVRHAWKLLEEGNSIELVDRYLRGTSHYNPKEVLRCIHIALLCVQQSPVNRPDMSFVVQMLASDAELPQPEPPGYFMKMDPPERRCLPSMPESSSINEMTISLLEPR